MEKRVNKPPASGHTTLLKEIAKQCGITEKEASLMATKFFRRAKRQKFVEGWWLKLIDAQFQTHIGPYARISCGDEREMAHLIPDPGGLCHDCGCALGEYHVFGCDAEECSNCGDQAFCCGCDE